MSEPTRRSERLINQGRTRRYQGFDAEGRDDFDYHDYGRRIPQVVGAESSSSDSDNFQSASSGSGSLSDCSNTTVIEQVDQNLEEISLLLENQLSITTCVTMEELRGDREYRKLARKVDAVVANINDHFDECPANACQDIDDLNRIVSKMEKLRSDLREVHVDLIDYMSDFIEGSDEVSKKSEQYEADYDGVLKQIKAYIANCNQVRTIIRNNQATHRLNLVNQGAQRANDELGQQTRTTNFILAEVERMINELTTEFSKSNVDVTDEELSRRNRELPDFLNRVDKLSKKFQQFLQTIPEGYQNFNVVVTGARIKYDNLIRLKDLYSTFVKNEVQEREVLKENSFKTSYLNIKLEPFSGYNSSLDIFSFQEQFEKLYSKSTPSKMLPDLLKNNYLADPALSLVKRLTNLAEIWARLQKAYGDSRIMLKNKLSEVRALGPLWKLKEVEKIKDCLVKLINSMDDLLRLSTKFNIEQKLYHGDAFDIIQGMMGEPRLTRWLTSISEVRDLDEADKWERLTQFFERELKVQEEKALMKGRAEAAETPKDSNDRKDKAVKKTFLASTTSVDCKFCGEGGHVATNGPNRSKIVQYFACKKFCELDCAGRFKELNAKGFCHQCLFPGADKSDARHANGRCQSDYICKNNTHIKFPCKKHVLVCHEHCQDADNVKLLEDYVARFIAPNRSVEQFSKEIKLSFLSLTYAVNRPNKLIILNENDEDPVQDRGIYLLQISLVEDEQLTYFFDGGCSDSCVSEGGVQKLGERATLMEEGPIELGGVNDFKVETPHGVYCLKLPLANGKNAVLEAVCLDKITTTLPKYQLGDIEKDIHAAYHSSGGEVGELPRLPEFVGGDVDVMIGTKYNRYMPDQVFKMPSGLAIHKSAFNNVDGSRGVIGGPHPLIRKMEDHFRGSNMTYTSFFSQQFQIFRNGVQVNPDVRMLNSKPRNDFDVHVCRASFPSIKSKLKQFEQVEDAGSEIWYRCKECRGCPLCKSGGQIETISIREEVEQDVINKSVTVDLEAGKTTARLPLLHDIAVKLAPNKDQALKAYKRVVKQINKNPSEKQDVIKAEKKLQDKGHVEYVKNLPPEVREFLRQHPVQNYLIWHPVWNENSLSTSTRIVFNFSLPTPSSYSVNDLLAKGRNNMNKLVEIFIAFRTHSVGYHTDVEQMYPTIKLDQEHWCMQRYLFQESLDPDALPEEKVIMRVIYGAVSSGNQAERGIRETARLQESDYPEVKEIVHKKCYVDDCMSGEADKETAYQRADEMALVLKRGGFNLKGFTFSGEDPPSHLTEDGESVKVAGVRWYSKSDELQLDVGDVNFARRRRGKKVVSEKDRVIPEKLTRRMCTSKVAEVYDLTGRFAPLIACMKLDLRDLVTYKLDWDDVLPDNLRNVWVSHFEMIKEISKVRFKRAVVPSDAVSLDINTIDAGDASRNVACSAIYVRFLRKCGSYSCQLIFSRTKLLNESEGATQPRAEMTAALLNTHTGEVVRRALSKHHKHSIKLTDSKILLCWINNPDIPLKSWTRNRAMEILRFTEPDSWLLVKSGDMIADLGTRRGASIEDVLPDSAWDVGYPWMTKDVADFPALKYKDITLSEEDNVKVDQEVIQYQGFPCKPKEPTNPVPKEVAERYQFSNYIVDPNRHRFRDVVRLVALVQRFIANCRKRVAARKSSGSATDAPQVSRKGKRNQTRAMVLSKNELKDAEDYYYRKATNEVKHFVKKEKYQNISREVNGILYYSGRVLPDQDYNCAVELTGIMKDLTKSTFCVPLVEKHSPVAYSLVNEVHWYDPVAMHAGVETNLRYTLQHAYIMEGRELVKKFKKGCERCRYLYKRMVEVAMGPVSSNNMAIAPPFYICQIDLAGPFKAYSPHNKRTELKVYYSVFCCTTTTTVNIKLLEDYSTSGFLLAFIRFACEVGYPKLMMIDEGSQLVKGCQSMEFSFRDAQHRLNKEYDVEFDCCPVGGHNFNGRVERKIRTIKECIEKSVHNERLSIIRWETLGASIANSINDLPIAKGNVVSELEHLDLITPNRLKLGRNNARSPEGPLSVTRDFDKIILDNTRIFNAWFELWLISCVPKLMMQPKWFDSDRDVQVGDIVLFLKKEGLLNKRYQYGKVTEVKRGRDDLIREVKVMYRNHEDNVTRTTNRAVRELIVIHAVDELNIIEELGKVASRTDATFLTHHC